MHIDNLTIVAAATAILLLFCGGIPLYGVFHAYKHLAETSRFRMAHLFEFVMATMLILCGIAILMHGSFSLIIDEKENSHEFFAATMANFIALAVIYPIAFTLVWVAKRLLVAVGHLIQSIKDRVKDPTLDP